MTLSKPAAITLDLWWTLITDFIHEEPAKDRRRLRTTRASAVLSEFGEDVDQDRLFAMFISLSAEIADGHDRGIDQSHVRWIKHGLTQLDSDLPVRIGPSGVRAVAAAVDQAFMDHPPILPDGSIELLDRLLARGLRIGLISNTGLTSDDCFREWFVHLGLTERFNPLSFSNELAVAKPAGRIFDHTLAALEVSADRALHVGDNMHADVSGAAAVGMSTVWVRRRAESPVRTRTEPDFVVDSVLELVPIVDQWLESLEN